MVDKNGRPRCVPRKGPSKWTPKVVEKILKEMIAWFYEERTNYFMDEFLVKQGYSSLSITRTIGILKKDGNEEELQEIMVLLGIANKIQEMKILKDGLNKTNDSALTKMFLACRHKYKEDIDRAANNVIFNQQIIHGKLESKSAEENSRNYSQLVRGLQASQSTPLPRPEEICADIE